MKKSQAIVLRHKEWRVVCRFESMRLPEPGDRNALDDLPLQSFNRMLKVLRLPT